MKSATMITLGVAVSLLCSSLAEAQQAPMPMRNATMRRANPEPAAQSRTTMPRAERPEPTYQMLDFRFSTGGDDLRQDSSVTAVLTFPDSARQICHLHGAGANGAAANISWDNNSSHDAPPCRLVKPRSLSELRDARITLQLWGPGSEPTFGEAIFAGPLALGGLRSQDNWNINRVIVSADNPESSDAVCVRSVSDNPVARLTGDQPQVTISDFPNQCR